ncbi:hypothetical protein [Glycomyces tarimensis]
MAYSQPPQYPQQPPPPPHEPKQRPMSVTVVVWTMYLTAAVLVVTAIGQFAAQGAVKDAVEEALVNDPALSDAGFTSQDVSALVTVSLVIGAAVYIIFAAFYAVLGLFDAKGKQPARIMSWILAGIGLACCGFGGLINQIGATTYSVSGEQYNDDMTQAMMDATPAWLTALQWISVVLFIVGSLVIIILLAVPSSNAYFRKEQPEQGYYPGQPPYGQPPYGQQPPQGPYPGQ